MRVIIAALLLLLSYACAETYEKKNPADYEIVDSSVQQIILAPATTIMK